ncbi:rod shape-determining protein MreD [Nitrosomonas sp.]|uniref:rod shape-determining protein MreD n=1 Tax=Nitrosomonas sp. TaxID=42353 RepID=UPI0020860267|nr:rod shape-determining protein MreD [Nitrosomonas sp.]GJL76304.1 MAG: rod shape-determining protein [Nitrosomonas sp.]
MSLKIIDESKIHPNKYVSRDMLAPAKLWYVLLSIALALILNFIPSQSFLLTARPDFAALVILFWSINQPQRMGMSLAFCIGLMMDVHSAGILGHHALAYCVIVYIASVFRRRLKIFNLIQQAPQVGLILLIMQGLLVLIALLNGSNLPDWAFFLASLTSAIVWPLIAFILSIPLRPGSDSEAI